MTHVTTRRRPRKVQAFSALRWAAIAFAILATVVHGGARAAQGLAISRMAANPDVLQQGIGALVAAGFGLLLLLFFTIDAMPDCDD